MTIASMPYVAMSTLPASQANSTKQSMPPDQIGKDGVLTKPSPRISPSSPASRARRARSSTTSRDEPNGDTPTWNPADDAVTRAPLWGNDASASAAAARPGRTLGQEPGQRL